MHWKMRLEAVGSCLFNPGILLPFVEIPKYYAEAKRVEINSTCSKRGPLELQEPDSDSGRADGEFVVGPCQCQQPSNLLLVALIVWAKRFLQVRRPYVIITSGERDPVMRDILHLGQIKIQYSQVSSSRKIIHMRLTPAISSPSGAELNDGQPQHLYAVQPRPCH